MNYKTYQDSVRTNLLEQYITKLENDGYRGFRDKIKPIDKPKIITKTKRKRD